MEKLEWCGYPTVKKISKICVTFGRLAVIDFDECYCLLIYCTVLYLDFACWSILDVVSCYMYSTLSLVRDGSVPVFACVPS